MANNNVAPKSGTKTPAKTKPDGKVKAGPATAGPAPQAPAPPTGATPKTTPAAGVRTVGNVGSFTGPVAANVAPKPQKGKGKGSAAAKPLSVAVTAVSSNPVPGIAKVCVKTCDDPSQPFQVPRLRFKLDCRINDSNGDPTLANDFPGVHKEEVTTCGVNEHTVLHNTRKFMAQDMYHSMHLTQVHSVNDVGGAVHRDSKVAKAYKMVYHSMNPICDSADVTRVEKYRKAHPDLFCEHTLQQCDCPRADCLTFVHSLYYFTPLEVGVALLKTNRRMGFAVLHLFRGQAGSLPDGRKAEAVWSRTTDGNVAMQVNGNNFVYEHGACDWLEETGYHFVDDTTEEQGHGGKWTLAWELLKAARGTFLFKFVVAPGHLRLACSKLKTTPLPDNALQLMQITQVYEERWFTTYYRVNGDPWVIHNGLYRHLRAQGVGKMPNKNSYQMLTDTARKYKEHDVDPTVLIQTVTVAFVHNASDLNAAQFGMIVVAEMLEGVAYLNYVAPPKPSLTQVAIQWGRNLASLVTDVGPVLGHVRNTLAFMGGVLALKEPSRISVSYNRVEKWVSNPELVAKEWKTAAQLNSARMEQFPHPKLDFTSRITLFERRAYHDARFLSSSKWYHPKLNITPNTQVSFGPTPFIIAENVGFANTPSSTSDANKVSALMHRLMKGNEFSNWEMVQAMETALDVVEFLEILPSARQAKEYMDLNPVLEMEEFALSEYGGRIFPAKKKRMDDAIRTVRENRHKDDFYVEWFVKGENAPAKQDGNKCRGIFVPVPTFTCRVSPWLYRLTKMVVAHTQQDGSSMSISAGWNAPRLGKWMDDATSHFGNQFFIVEIDISAFEANQTFEQNATWFDKYEQWTLGMSGSSEFIKLMRSSNNVEFREVRHFGKNRVSWGKVSTRKGSMTSGVPDVTLRNSGNSVASFVGLLFYVGVPRKSILGALRSLILGDDNFSLIALKYRHLFDEASVIKYYKNCWGWDVKVKFVDAEHVSSAEYCSCYFVQTANGYRITPKMGRIFSKTFFLDDKLEDKARIIYGLLLGLGHYETGYLFSACVYKLALACKRNGVDRPKAQTLNDYMWHPEIGTDEVKLPSPDALEADLARYEIGPDDAQAFLEWFGDHVTASNFPLRPLILPAGQPTFTRMIAVDLPFCMDDLTGDRVDTSRQDRNRAVLLPGANGKFYPHTSVLDIFTDVPAEP